MDILRPWFSFFIFKSFSEPSGGNIGALEFHLANIHPRIWNGRSWIASCLILGVTYCVAKTRGEHWMRWRTHAPHIGLLKLPQRAWAWWNWRRHVCSSRNRTVWWRNSSGKSSKISHAQSNILQRSYNFPRWQLPVGHCVSAICWRRWCVSQYTGFCSSHCRVILNKRMIHQLDCRSTRCRVTFQAKLQETFPFLWETVWDFRYIFTVCDLKYCCYPLVLVPRRSCRRHFNNGTAQTPYVHW